VTKLLRRLHYLIRQRRLDAELAEEIDAHRAMRQRDLEQRGIAPAEAAHASRRALGNVTLSREDARAVWLAPWLESVWQDVVYALRLLRREPLFASAVVLVMAIGIGAATGVFGLLHGLVLKSLPVRHPDRLVYFAQPSFSYPIFQEVGARASHVFSGLSAWDLASANVEWTTEIEPAEVLTASGGFYGMLGIAAAAGRTFGADDDRVGGGDQGLVAVISHAAWQRRFGGDMTAVGRTIRIDGRPFTIVGVTPREFSGVAPGLAPEITIPLTALANDETLRGHSSSWVHLLGRLRDGLTLAQADAALQAVWPSVLASTTPATMPADRRAMYLGRQTRLEPGHAGYSRVRNRFQEPLWMLLALVGLLAAVASASAANLLFARGLARRREIAMRLAIGAGRWRLVRQMLTESAVWTAIAAVVGVGLAAWGGAALVGMMRTRDDPIVLDVTPDWGVLGFALALAFATAAIAVVLPALRATRLDPSAALKGIGASDGGLLRGWSAGKTLVATQVALTLVLLVGAALFVRSLQRVLSENAGFDRDRVLVVSTDPEATGYRGDRFAAFYERLLERLRAVPGVEAASLSQYPPISDQDGAWTQSVEIDGVPLALESERRVHFNAVSPHYFRTLGMRVLRGRDFGLRDNAAAPRVVAINDAMARRFFGAHDPLGRLMTVGRNAARRNLEIVAVVSDAKYQRLQEPSRPIAYLPCAQQAEQLADEPLFVDVRAAAGAPMAEAIRREIRALDARMPVRVETVGDRIRSSVVRERVTAALATALGLAALALACAALYGLLAYAVSRQTHEIGVRLAIGATRGDVLWLVLRDCLAVALVGTAAGLCAALALGRYARTLLFQISPADPVALAAAVLVMLGVAAMAGLVPARRAARVDPAIALRQE
jgi:putative ABC transport system permease protein